MSENVVEIDKGESEKMKSILNDFHIFYIFDICIFDTLVIFFYDLIWAV